MTLLLPLLMLGVAASAEQPQPAATDQRPAIAVTKTGSAPEVITRKPFTMPESANPFVSDRRSQKNSLEAQDEMRDKTCFTMRSYFFEREDDQAMTFVGMTKCDPGRAVTQKHVRGRARLVPAN
jgi:hypothetical protein